jgi:UDP-glucose 4-epimerase
MEKITNQCPKLYDIKGERILIFGGSGSLGRTTISRWINDNEIINVSRSEDKQWSLRMFVKDINKDDKLIQMIGDISNPDEVSKCILESKPTIICIFACLKHIDLCEKQPDKAIKNNTNGIINVHSALSRYNNNVHTVLFVSTDKACLPITSYGCSKALSEFYLQSIKSDVIKYVGIRYGNVLNSSGSIIPYLNSNKDPNVPYTLTHEDMTRFIMTLDHSVNLIEYAINNGKNNEIIIPHIESMKITDIFSIFESKYNKTRVLCGLRCKEKIHEDLLSPSEALHSYYNKGYYHLTNRNISNNDITPINSSMNIISKDILQLYLKENSYI